MANFKSTDTIGLSFFMDILLITAMLLLIALVSLWLLKKYKSELFLKKLKKNISVVETHSDVRLGTLAIVTAHGKSYLVVASKMGVCMCALGHGQIDPIQDVETEELDQNV